MLEKIKSPNDVQKLTFSELSILAKEVRKRIVDVTSEIGGHIAPSLGATDISIALLKVFSPLEDRIIWDVGHQSYAYKILTERNDRFDTIRQFGGLGGFNDPEESKYDSFRVGHCSTSISAALGIAMAKEKQKLPGKTIAIIGDGALTGGMAFEGLNYTGHVQQKDMIVILNDNKMSISKNIGGLQKYLTDMLVSKSYNSLKKQVWDISEKLPDKLRNKFVFGAQKVEESLINILVPNIIFEDLGFKYVGPIDGHDIPRLVRVFNKVKNFMHGPIFIHVVTQKGKGYKFAEQNATKFHGLGPFSEITGENIGKKSESFSSFFGKKLSELANNNPNIVAITAAMTDGTGLKSFAKNHPDKIYDVGIAEQHAVTFAGGLAIQGMKPFVALYSTFLQRAYDQIIHDVALQNLPVVFCIDRAGLVGEDGPTHHGSFDISFLNPIPNLVIMAPSCAEDFGLMLEFCEKYNDSPIAIRYPRGKIAFHNKTLPEIKLGKSHIIQKGEKVALIGFGTGVKIAKDTEVLLKEEYPNSKFFLINARFSKPLDTEMLDSLKSKVNYIFTFEENSTIGGFGSMINEYFAESEIKVKSFGLPDKFITHGNVTKLYESIDFTARNFAKEISKRIKKYYE
jgi:1-deoxy-D-xylulose-5-phosphate synthase